VWRAGVLQPAPEAEGGLYELGGPWVYTYKDLVRLVLARTGREPLLLPVPFLAWEVWAALTAPLPTRPFSRDQVALMRRDKVVAAGALTLAGLGVAPTPLEAILPTCIGRDPDR
jgi:uncharacterized protein YbjT (DUF2867 family)